MALGFQVQGFGLNGPSLVVRRKIRFRAKIRFMVRLLFQFC